MEEQNDVPNIALLMSGPLEIQRSGRVSSVCLHPTKDLAVSAHEDGFWNQVHCSIFAVNKQAVDKIVTHPNLISSGKHTSVAVVYKEEGDKTIAIATYRSIIFKNVYCRIGLVNVSRESIY